MVRRFLSRRGFVTNIHFTIQDRQQLPAKTDWLTPTERVRFEGFRFEKRRQDWLLGRWAAKIALLEFSGLQQRDIARFEIRSAPDGAPLPILDGRRCPVQVSLSHSNDRAFAAVLRGDDALGCDIELVEPRSAGFVETYFTAAERDRVERAESHLRNRLITLIWSAKESTLKALRTGLKADTRSVEVTVEDDDDAVDWQSAKTIATDAGEFSCLWRDDGDFVVSIVTREPAEARAASVSRASPDL